MNRYKLGSHTIIFYNLRIQTTNRNKYDNHYQISMIMQVIGVTQISKNRKKLVTENNSIKQSAVYHDLVNFRLEMYLIYGGQVLRSTVNIIMFVFNYNNKIMNQHKSLT